MPRELILPVSILMALTAFGLIAKWYVMPALVSRPRATALEPLLLLHSFRFVGLACLGTPVFGRFEVAEPRNVTASASGRSAPQGHEAVRSPSRLNPTPLESLCAIRVAGRDIRATAIGGLLAEERSGHVETPK